MSYVGVDGCRNGWIAIEICDGVDPVAHHVGEIGELADLVPNARVVGIDIPIGLPSGGRRRADSEAMEMLGARRSSLFSTPPRQVLEAPTHALATRVAVELTGQGISQQSFALRQKILEVDAWLPLAPWKVVEVHPETSFVAMLGAPAKASKKTWAGMVERRHALASAGIHLDGLRGPAAAAAAVDDMLDAAAAAWTARRVFHGRAQSLPDPVEVAESGIEMAIWV
jgi:predicted RNase H-like nuclease